MYSSRRTWDKKTIIKTIKKLYYDGIDLMASNMRDNYADLFNAARRCEEIGSWKRAIYLSGFNYNDICGEQWGTKYIGKDNNQYMSITEGMVADALYDLQKNKKIQSYKTQVRVVKGRKWTCDFVYLDNNNNSTWLEVDGLEESRKEGSYNEYNEKIHFYREKKFNYKVVNSYKDIMKIIEEE